MPGSYDVIVIGGGSTGCGVARDLALRGASVALLERNWIASGTTGRMHRLLHSGARYAETDEMTARECIRENKILQDIAASCIRDTGGLFVQLTSDDPSYVDHKRSACQQCGIATERVSGATAREREPSLSALAEQALVVPDAVVDSIQLTVANAVDAAAHGARIELDATVTDLEISDDQVRGVHIIDSDGEESTLHARHVINASGVWAAELANLADISLTLELSKGAMVVAEYPDITMVLNRCRPRGEGDIIVPYADTAILGTTDVAVDGPEGYAKTDAETAFLRQQLSELVPAVEQAPIRDTFWGVRPLFTPVKATGSSTAVTRDHSLIDHGERDGIKGFTSIVGGKLTTYRSMAEDVADHVCDHLGIQKSCQTDSRALPQVTDDQLTTYTGTADTSPG